MNRMYPRETKCTITLTPKVHLLWADGHTDGETNKLIPDTPQKHLFLRECNDKNSAVLIKAFAEIKQNEATKIEFISGY